MLGKHPRGCSLLSLPSFFALVCYSLLSSCCHCWVIPFAGYWRYRQYVLLVIVCLMDQTILIEFNYIACAFPLSPFSAVVVARGLSQLLLVLVICNNSELLPRHSSPLICEICRCHGLLICTDVLAKPSPSTKQVCVPLCVFWG